MKRQLAVFSAFVLMVATSVAFASQSSQDQANKAKKATVTVVSVDTSANTITAKDKSGASLTFNVSPQTKITKNGQDIALADIKANDNLTIDYNDESGTMTASTVRVVSSTE